MLIPRDMGFGLANGLRRKICTESLVLAVVKRVKTGKYGCRTVRFANRNTGALDVDSHVTLYGVTMRTNTGANVFRTSRGTVRCLGRRKHRPGTMCRDSPSTICTERCAFSLSGIHPMITGPSFMSGIIPTRRTYKVRVGRTFLKSYGGKHVRSLHINTRVVGNGGITRNIEFLIIPTDRAVCHRTLGRKLVSAFVRTKTVIVGPGYDMY